jgi:hypothetical protein
LISIRIRQAIMSQIASTLMTPNKKAVAVDRVVQPYELEEQRGTTGLA